MEEKLDILAVHPSCLVSTNRAILRELIKRGLSIELVIGKPDSKHKVLAEPQELGDPYIHMLTPIFSVNPSRLRSFIGITKLVLDKKPRIIWIEDEPASLMAIQLGVISKITGSTLLAFNVENRRYSVLSSLREMNFRAIVRNITLSIFTHMASLVVDWVLVCSNDGGYLMEKRGFAGRAIKAPIGFDPELFKPNNYQREKIREYLGLTEVTIAYFGRIVSEKGIADLIRALGQLKNYRWTLLIDDFTGFENSFSKELKYLIDKENIKNRVIYINATHLEMSAYMNATDIVVVPSRTTKTFKEQYGRVVPESMACGKLVIATNSGTLPELLGEAGVVIPEGDLEILTKTIKDATLRFHEFKSLRMKASQRAINELSVTAQADILQHWYEKVISSRV